MRRYGSLVVVLLSLALALAASACSSGTGTTAQTSKALGAIAYVQGGDIWVKALPDGAPRQLTHRAADAATGGHTTYSKPAWSPSGQWLTFLKDKQQEVMRADGSGVRSVGSPGAGWAAWSPTADRLAYTDLEGDLVVENADGSGRTVIASWIRSAGAIGGLDDVTWSADGAQIAYVEQRAAVGHPAGRLYEGIWRVPADGPAPPTEVFNTGTPPKEGLGIVTWTRAGLLMYRAPAFTADLADGVTLEEIKPRT